MSINVNTALPDILTAACAHTLRQRVLPVQRGDAQSIGVHYLAGSRGGGAVGQQMVGALERVVVLQQLEDTLQ